eukprot:TRINITY_DN6528_c0_g1_i1.p1 TRINITY_DN6528_c0_g1~~TRINITY_DN6528_c0_g1_i1.p1  ORF type:complete len:212 (+),score=52.32 TRINITY_DN6528_c0_g1_i1:45-638(+)
MATEEEAAVRIQALQRGRQARKEVEEKKVCAKREPILIRPFAKETEEEAIILFRRRTVVEEYGSLENLIAALQSQLPNKTIKRDQIYYSTCDHPEVYSNLLTAEKFNQVKELNASHIAAQKLEIELKELENSVVSQEAEDGQKRTKAQVAKEEKARLKKIRKMQNDLEMAKYNISLQAAKLANFHKLHGMKVVFVSP